MLSKHLIRSVGMCVIVASWMGGSSLAVPVDNPALPPVSFKPVEAHAPLRLVENGEIKFAIIADRQAEKGFPENKSVTLAVDLLLEAMERCIGQKPEVFEIIDAEKAKAFPYQIILGDNALTRALGMNASKLPEEGFEVKSFPGGIAIVGYDLSLTKDNKRGPLDTRGSQTGTLYGAMDFCERFLGTRTFYPGEWGSLFPKVITLSIDPVNYTDYPRFADRDRYFTNLAYQGKEKQEKWAPLVGTYAYQEANGLRFDQRLRQAKRTPFFASHNPNPHTFAKAYPDRLETIFYRTPSGNQMYDDKYVWSCYFDITNLEFADLLVESLKKYYATDGKENDGWAALSEEYISFGQCDSEVPLRDMTNNPAVMKYGLLANGNTEYNNIYARFYQYLAERIKEEFPGKKLTLLPYANYFNAPTDPRYTLPDNVELRVCFYALSTIHKEETREKGLKQIKDWYAALGNRPVASLWLYNVPNEEFARAVVPGFTDELVKLLGGYLGRQDLFLDQWGDLEPYYYLANYAANRSMWNPDFNVAAAIEEHWAPFYGNAAPYLKAFYRILLENYIERFENGQKLYPASVYDRLEALLATAEKSLEPDSIEMKRFQVFAAPWPTAIQKKRNLLNYERPVHGVRKLLPRETITVDGKLDETVWTKANPIVLRDPNGSNDPLKFPSDLKLAWDQTGIYGGFSFPYSPKRDPAKSLWENCNVEVFLSSSLKGEFYNHYAIDSLNNRHIGFQGPEPLAYNGKWQSPGFKSVVTADEKGWVIEFFIPYEDLKVDPPAVGDNWLANIVRNKLSTPPEYSGNSLTPAGNNHHIDTYGIIKFLGEGE